MSNTILKINLRINQTLFYSINHKMLIIKFVAMIKIKKQ